MNSEAPRIVINSVAVIEWLAETERKTGKELAERLTAALPIRGIEKYIDYRSCATKAEVMQSLAKLADDAKRGRRPVLHLEAHGFMPEGERLPSGLCASASPVESELLTWNELMPALQSLNEATETNLVVFFAACWGMGGIFTIPLPGRSPFVGMAGYTAPVSPSDLFETAREFYVELFQSGMFGTAVVAANREFRTKGVELDAVTSQEIFVGSIEQLLGERTSPEEVHRRALDVAVRVIRDNGLAMDRLPYSRGIQFFYQEQIPHLKKFWEVFFWVDKFPENASRFAVDLAELVAPGAVVRVPREQ